MLVADRRLEVTAWYREVNAVEFSFQLLHEQSSGSIFIPGWFYYYTMLDTSAIAP